MRCRLKGYASTLAVMSNCQPSADALPLSGRQRPDMASLNSITFTSTTNRHNNVVPAWLIEQKRQQRAERLMLVANTIIGQAIEQEAATQ